MKLNDKVALITGSSKGIGAAIAKAFAKEGAHVIVNYRVSDYDAKKVVAMIGKSGGRASLLRSDVSNEKDVSEMFGSISKKFGRLDILVNNAGLSDASIWNAKLPRITREMWDRVISVDVIGSFLCAKYSAKLMNKGGAIINISSTPALVGDTQGLVYACAKASVLTMTKMLARILAPKIRVNCMILGSIETGWVQWLSKNTLKAYRSSIPLRRFGNPKEVAGVAVFLGSNDSSYITGQSIVVDGGDVMD